MADERAPRTRAVLLDCLGTLLRLEPPAPRLRTELGARGIDVSAAAAAEAFRAEIAYYLEHHVDGADAGSLDRLRDACGEVVRESLGVDSDQAPSVRAAMLAAIRFSPYPDAGPALRALRANGLRLVVASNWDCSLGRALEATGLAPLLDGVVTSAEVGAAKPDPAPFRAALEVAGCGADQAVCVGDSLERDVAGARRAGMAAILLTRAEREPMREASGAADATVPVARSLEEARRLVLSRR